jgi:hypothetical protein
MSEMPERLPGKQPPPNPEHAASDADRREALNQAVGKQVRKGWRVENQTEFSASIAKGKRPNHVLHLILTIVTAGLWAIVWIILAITKHEDRRFLQVDAYGRVTG